MEKYTKRLPLLVVVAILTLFLTSFNANPVKWLPNFHSAINFTVINSKAYYKMISIGSANYIYLNLSLIKNLGTYVWLQGYNGTVFRGNITAYPYADGLLVPLKTIRGLTYNTITLFFNQTSIEDTYFYS